MSYVNPGLKDKIDSLPDELRNEILSRNVQINTMHDLMAVLESIVEENR